MCVSLVARAGVAIVALTALAAAQQVVVLTGVIRDGAGGPLVPGVVYRATGSLVVPANQTLTVQAGAVLKFDPQQTMTVYGTLRTYQPSVFTSIDDDTVGGDTGGNGPSTGHRGDWGGVGFQPGSGGSVLQGLEVRFAGSGGWNGIHLVRSDISMSTCTVRDCAADGVSLGNSSLPAMVGCRFERNAGWAIDEVPIDALPGFANNGASLNGFDALRISVGAMTRDVTIDRTRVLGDVVVSTPSISVPSGTTLTIRPGVVVKFTQTFDLLGVSGVLDARGTAAEPIVLTSFRDDACGGDTNGDGPSSGVPGDWSHVALYDTADTSVLEHVVVRYTGGNSSDAVRLTSCDATLRSCTVQSGGRAGLSLTNSTGGATVERCRFEDNGGAAVDLVPLDAVPGFLANTAARNAGGDYIHVYAGTPRRDVRIDAGSILNGALVVESTIDVPAGRRLTFGPGVVVKFERSYGYLRARGMLAVLGTAQEPVVFTSFTDDRFAGDTNGDGPSQGTPGNWRGLHCIPDPGNSQQIEHAVIAFAGQQSDPGLWVYNARVAAHAVRAEHGAGPGLRAQGLNGIAANWVVFDNRGVGIDLTGGSFTVAHATAASNGGAGIAATAGFNGAVRNSIAWGQTPNLQGLAASAVWHCDGDPALAGTQGNLHLDPRFVDAVGGDLRLAADSPCLGAADGGTARTVVEDHLQAPRLLDHALTGAMLADMGAFERPAWEVDVAGTPTMGTVLTLTVQGPPGHVLWLIGPLDGHTELAPLGAVLAGRLASVTVLSAVFPVGAPLPIPLPGMPGFEGLELGVQPLAFVPAPTPRGNLLPVYRARLRR